MKTILSFLTFLLISNLTIAQTTAIPDTLFEQELINLGLDTGAIDGVVLTANIDTVTAMYLSNKVVYDLTGIQDFAALTYLDCSQQLTYLDVTQNTALTYLDCGGNQLISLDITNNTALTSLHCQVNQLNSLDVSQNTALTDLECWSNQLNSLDITQNTALTSLYCSQNLLSSLNVTQNTALINLYCYNNQLTTLDVTQNIALNQLRSYNNPLTTLDVTQNTALILLFCNSNQLSALDLTNNTALTDLHCGGNQLISLDMTNNTALTSLRCDINQLTSLNVTNNSSLIYLSCAGNQLATLNVTNNTSLNALMCQVNQLTNIDVTNNVMLDRFACGYNQLTSLDLRNNIVLSVLDCIENQLTTLDISNGNNTAMTDFLAFLNPNLTCISVDDPVWSISNWTTNIDPQTSFSSNCNCGNFTVSIDSTQNVSCVDSGYVWASASGIGSPFNYIWTTTPPTNDSILVTDSTGLYILKVIDTNNCERFKTALLNGPNNMGGFDLNTNLFEHVFRPGDSSMVDLSAWNDGCIPTSGQLSISYSGPITFISASIPPDSISPFTLKWNFTNWDYLSPQFFSSLQFMVDTTANLGDLLCFDVIITPIAGDADTVNNIKSYCFSVVNSYDPNDKQVYPQGTCAENYVLKNKAFTYTVRFQNTGTAPAIDIYILDSLSNNFNVNTLRVVSKSHGSLITEVLGNNIIKFRFDNINLPNSLSDEQGSHGYITYEIYPYFGLNDGKVIENSAAIYFDFNSPIITNSTINTLTSVLPTTDTTIMNESSASNFTLNNQTYTQTGSYNQYFHSNDGCDSVVVINLTITTGIEKQTLNNILLYPNPTTGDIFIEFRGVKTNIKATLTNSLGQVLLTKNYAPVSFIKLNIDAPKGVYFLKLQVPEGNFKTIKVLKQ